VKVWKTGSVEVKFGKLRIHHTSSVGRPAYALSQSFALYALSFTLKRAAFLKKINIIHY
jgi:hypothetical protein